MNAKAYLEQYRQLQLCINGNRDELLRLTLLGTKTGEDVSDVFDRLKAEIRRETESMTDKREEISRAVDLVDNSLHRNILRLRYINGLSWGKIANQTAYTKSWLMQQHREALEDFERVYQKALDVPKKI